MNRLRSSVHTIFFLFTLTFLSLRANAATFTVTVNDDFFSPKNITINVGDKVTWAWLGAAQHDCVSVDGLWKSPLQGRGTSFSFTFNNAGTFNYFCTPHRAIGMVGSVTVVGAANQAPTVTLTDPAPNATFQTTDNINFAATASDPDGSVTKVEFLSDGNVIGTATSAPYSAQASLPAGTHSITARATDNGGLSTTTSPITITVSAQNSPPTVTLTSPADGATFQTTDTITFSADATDDQSVAKVEFFTGRTLIGAATSAPYSVQASLPAGSYTVFARATDNTGQVTSTPSVTINVVSQNQPPNITLSSPQSGSVLAAPANILLSATATDDGAITQVEFFQDGVSLGSVTTAPYEITVQGLGADVYNFTAVAHDNSGLAAASTPVQIRVAAQPHIQSITQNGDTFTVTASATDGISHDLEATADFVNWTVVNTATATNGSVTLTDTSPQPMRFYRVVAR